MWKTVLELVGAAILVAALAFGLSMYLQALDGDLQGAVGNSVLLSASAVSCSLVAAWLTRRASAESGRAAPSLSRDASG